MKVTSALANKMIKQLEEEKSYWNNREAGAHAYTAAIGEEPVIPEYDYEKVSETLDTIDRRIVHIKHAVNVSNTTSTVQTEEGTLTIDAVLIRMAQLNARRSRLDILRKKLPKERLTSTASWGNMNKVPEYRFLNYDIEKVKADYEKISRKILNMQMVLDKHNQTHEFDIDD